MFIYHEEWQKKYSPGVVSHVGLHGGIGHRVAQDTSERHYPGVILNPSKVQWSKTQQGLIFLKKSWNSWKFKQVIPSPIKNVLFVMSSSPQSAALALGRSSHAVALNWTATPNRWTPGIGSAEPISGKFLPGSWEESEVNVDFTQNGDFFGIPSGKHTKNDGKSPCLMGKLTISMVIFNSKLLNYQRVIRREWWNLMEIDDILSWNFEKIGEHQPQQPPWDSPTKGDPGLASPQPCNVDC